MRHPSTICQTIDINVTWLQRFPASSTSVLNFKYDWPSPIVPVICSMAECVGGRRVRGGQIS